MNSAPKPPALELAELREALGGDRAAEAALFASFFESAAELTAALSHHCTKDSAEAWEEASHALKGAAWNVGAMPLAELCACAERIAQATPVEKHALVAQIAEEITRVRQSFLLQSKG